MILNLTQHEPTLEQIQQGVVSLVGKDKETLISLLTFENIPTAQELENRAEKIAELAELASSVYLRVVDTAMIGGAPFFMAPLEKALKQKNISSVYAFSRRVSVEQIVDGEVKKTSVFKHIGFVLAEY